MKKSVLSLLLILSALLLGACETIPESPPEEVEPAGDPRVQNYYQVFVRSFADGNNDGIGDFIGLEQSLDYFVDLGIEALWLMPIHPSPSYHGYDVDDYYDVHADYGTLGDFESFLSAADEKGIDVIIDFVINHSSDTHPWFEAFLAGDPDYQDYYRRIPASDDRVGQTGAWGQTIWHSAGEDTYYAGVFGGYMPDLNWSNPEVVQEIVDIGTYWLDKGVDGFRIDAAIHLFSVNELPAGTSSLDESLFQLEYFTFQIKSHDEDAFIVGEVWDNASIYQPFLRSMDSVFHFDYGNAVVNAVTQGFSRSYVEDVIKWHENALAENATAVQSPFLRNHDQNRLAGPSEPGYPNIGDDLEGLKLAAEMLLSVPGSPFIYYGDELGMAGAKAGAPPMWDATVRTPFLWDDSRLTTWTFDDYGYVDTPNASTPSVEVQMSDPNSLYSTYKAMLHLRQAEPALKYGDITAFEDNHPGLQGFYRTFESDTLLVLHNVSEESQFVELDGSYEVIYGTLEEAVPARSTVILRIDANE